MATRNLALLGLLALAVACGGDDDPTPPQQGEASMRVYHASPNAGPLDVVLNGETLKTELQYDDTVDYRTFATGAVDLQMRAAGTATNVTQVGGTASPGQKYTVLVIGRTGATTGPVIGPLALTDNARPAAGAASVRAVHASPGAGEVDFYFSAPGDDLASLNPILRRFRFGTATTYGDVILPGTYRVRLTPVNAKTPVIVDLPSVVIEVGQKVSLIAIGEGTAEQPFVIRVLQDQ